MFTPAQPIHAMIAQPSPTAVGAVSASVAKSGHFVAVGAGSGGSQNGPSGRDVARHAAHTVNAGIRPVGAVRAVAGCQTVLERSALSMLSKSVSNVVPTVDRSGQTDTAYTLHTNKLSTEHVASCEAGQVGTTLGTDVNITRLS